MGVRDAFGRKADEEPLVVMGWLERSPHHRGHEDDDGDDDSESRGWKRVALGFAVAGAMGGAGDVVNFIRGDDEPRPAAIARVQKANGSGGVPAGLRPGSLLRPSALDRALGRARTATRGRVVRYLRVTPGRVDLHLELPGAQRLALVTIHHGGELQKTIVGNGRGGGTKFAISEVPSAGPSNAVTAATRRAGRTTEEIGYVEARGTTAGLRWLVHFDDGERYLAGARGKILLRVD